LTTYKTYFSRRWISDNAWTFSNHLDIWQNGLPTSPYQAGL